MKFLCLAMTSCMLIGCVEKREFKIEYYDSHSKKSEGYYINNRPIDTLRTFYENGTIKSLEIFNTNSELNGVCKYYYENGVLSEAIPYDRNKKSGDYESFLSNGVLLKRAFFYEDLPMGDAFYFDSVSGKIKYYNFSNFDNKGLLLCEFNNNGEIIKEDEDFFFLDSINFNRKVLNDSVKVLMLISHRPKSRLALKIESLDANEKILASKDVDTKERLVKFNFPSFETSNRIRTTSIRYDSINAREKTFIIVRDFQ